MTEKESLMTKAKYTRKPNEFFAKYKHPNWQEKRLKVMDEAGFQCSHCGDKDSTLNVHHISYLKNRDPWEYENKELLCLCEGCHAEMHAMEDRLKDALHSYKVVSYQTMQSTEELIGYLVASSQQGPFRVKAHDDDGWLYGFLIAYRSNSKEFTADITDPGEFLNLRALIAADDGYIDHNWLRFYARDTLSSKFQADYIRNDGFYLRDGFPEWYEEKVRAMVLAWDGIEE